MSEILNQQQQQAEMHDRIAADHLDSHIQRHQEAVWDYVGMQRELAQENKQAIDLLASGRHEDMTGAELKQAKDLATKEAGLDSMQNRVIIDDGDGNKYWGAEYPHAFVFSGNTGIRGGAEMVNKDPSKNSGHGMEGFVKAKFTHVFVELDDGSRICFARTNDKQSAALQTFEVTSSNATPDENGNIQPRQISSEQLKDAVLEPGTPIATGVDPNTGKRLRSKANVVRIVAMNASQDGQVPPNHPMLNRPELQRNTVAEFQASLNSAEDAEDIIDDAMEAIETPEQTSKASEIISPAEQQYIGHEALEGAEVEDPQETGFDIDSLPESPNDEWDSRFDNLRESTQQQREAPQNQVENFGQLHQKWMDKFYGLSDSDKDIYDTLSQAYTNGMDTSPDGVSVDMQEWFNGLDSDSQNYLREARTIYNPDKPGAEQVVEAQLTMQTQAEEQTLKAESVHAEEQTLTGLMDKLSAVDPESNNFVLDASDIKVLQGLIDFTKKSLLAKETKLGGAWDQFSNNRSQITSGDIAASQVPQSVVDTFMMEGKLDAAQSFLTRSQRTLEGSARGGLDARMARDYVRLLKELQNDAKEAAAFAKS